MGRAHFTWILPMTHYALCFPATTCSAVKRDNNFNWPDQSFWQPNGQLHERNSNVGPNSELLMLRSIKCLTPTPDDRNHVWRKFLWNWPRERVHNRVRGCSHDTGATFVSTRAHSSSLSWFCICLHDATTKCHTRASHTGVSSHRFPTISCKRDTTTRFGVKSVPCAG